MNKTIYALKCLSVNLILHQDTEGFGWTTLGCNGCGQSEFCNHIKDIVNIEIMLEFRNERHLGVKE